jgi:hypothetical protein
MRRRVRKLRFRSLLTLGIASGVALLIPAASAPAQATACHLKWRVVRPFAIAGGYVSDVEAFSRTDTWILSTSLAGDKNFIGHWNGRHWRFERLSLDGVADAFSVSSSQDIWVVGRTLGLQPLIAHFDGRAWTQFPVPLGPNVEAGLSDVVALAPDDMWAVGSSLTYRPGAHAVALIMHWDGHDWTTVAVPGDEEGLSGIAALSPHDIWALGGDKEEPSGLVATVLHWDGTGWHDVSVEPAAVSFSGVTAVSRTNVWAVGSTAGTARRGVVAHWNGRRFRVIHTTGASGTDILSDVAVAGRHIWAVGAIEIDSFDGQRWRQAHLPGVVLVRADALSPRNVWAVGYKSDRTLIYHYACH